MKDKKYLPAMLLTLALYTANYSLPAYSAPGENSAGESLSFEHLNKNSAIVGLNYNSGANGYPIISDIYKGGPTDLAGLKKGDEILAVGNQETKYLGYLHLQTLLAGDQQNPVLLKIRSQGQIKNYRIVRAPVSSFKDLQLHKSQLAKWHNEQKQTETGAQAEHLIDLPFAILVREHHHPTLFEFVDETKSGATTNSVEKLLSKHSDGAYILERCKIVRINKSDKDYLPLSKYFGIDGPYALLPVFEPWLVTVKTTDLLRSLPNEAQMDHIARNLVRNSIRVQVSQQMSQQTSPKTSEKSVIKRNGLSHKNVIKRTAHELLPGQGVAGMGFAVAASGEAMVSEIFKGGPADKANLKKGDLIVKVNGVDSRFLGLEHIQAALVGDIGKSVALEIGSNNVTKKVILQYQSPRAFHMDKLSHMAVTQWQTAVSSNPDDTDEFELPCCMLARAGSKPTIFEFSEEANPPDADLKPTLEKLRLEKKLSSDFNAVQLIRYTKKDPDFEPLRNYFKIKTSYACLPAYYQAKHKTFKAEQISLESPPKDDPAAQVRFIQERLLSLEQSQ